MNPGATMASLGIAHHDPAHWPNLSLVPYLCPDFAFVLIGGIVLAVIELRRQARARGESWLRTLDRSPSVAFAAAAACLIVLSTLLVCFAPRYMAQAVPLAYLLFGFGLFGGAPGRRGRWKLMLLGGIVAFNLVNRGGALYWQIDAGPGAAHSEPEKARERSHEYERFLASNRAAANLLERDFPGVPLIVTAPFGHMLGEPRFGYVARRLNVACAGMRSDVFPHVPGLDEIRPEDLGASDPIYVRDRYCDPSTIPPPEPGAGAGDEILYQDRLSPPLVVYRKAWRDGPPADPEQIEPWYRQRGWDGKSLVDLVRHRLMALRTVGRKQQGEDELRRLVAALPNDAPVRVLWIGLLIADGKTEEAEEELLLATAAFPDQAWFPGSLGKLLLAQNRIVEAAGPIEDAARLAPATPEILATLAELRERQGRAADAAGVYLQLVALTGPGDSQREYRFRLAAAQHRANQSREAIPHLDSILAGQSGDMAVRQTTQFQARNLLAWILATHPDEKLRDGARAVALALENCQLTAKDDPEAWDTLAAAFAETGRFSDAIAAQEKCIEGLIQRGLTARIEAAQRKRVLYLDGKPYRDQIESTRNHGNSEYRNQLK